MSRVRTLYALACAGILITTGGCAESATAPSAVSAEASQGRFKNPTAEQNAAPEASSTEGDAAIAGGVILNGGGRY